MALLQSILNGRAQEYAPDKLVLYGGEGWIVTPGPGSCAHGESSGETVLY